MDIHFHPYFMTLLPHILLYYALGFTIVHIFVLQANLMHWYSWQMLHYIIRAYQVQRILKGKIDLYVSDLVFQILQVLEIYIHISFQKELKIIHLDGHNVAEINDLRSLSMSVLFKIFIEKFVDTNRHCTIFVCKFGLRNGCGTKFMDAKENRIHRLEHLIQCHLLEHLLKTKSGKTVESVLII